MYLHCFQNTFLPPACSYAFNVRLSFQTVIFNNKNPYYLLGPGRFYFRQVHRLRI
jgi:hypothetical protein